MLKQRHRRLRIETLENRTLLAADLVNGLLTVVGTNGNDNIDVQVATSGPNAGQLQVDVNGAQNFFDVNLVNTIQISGLSGNDQITVDDNVAIDTSINGGKGNDTIKGGSGSDTIHGDAGNDSIDGSDGDDVIFGDKGNDAILAGAGNDTADGGSGNDTIHGDDGDDTIRGNNGNDTLSGDANDDNIHGDNGKDSVNGDDGDDDVYGDNGSDSLDGGDDNDHLDGGNGRDDCHGGQGDDQLKGGRGHDQLDGDDGNNLLDPDKGHDDVEDGIEADLDSEFKAILTGAGDMSGKASYELENEDGQIKTNFELEVRNLAANSTLDVVIDGVTVGQVSTDGSGEGELHLSSDPSGDELPFPSGFPAIHLGSTILVADSVQGSFVTKFDS